MTPEQMKLRAQVKALFDTCRSVLTLISDNEGFPLTDMTKEAWDELLEYEIPTILRDANDVKQAASNVKD